MADPVIFRTDATLRLWSVLLLAFAGLAAAILGVSDTLPRLPALSAAVLLGLWALAILASWVSRRAVVYKVSQERIEIERGLLARRFESLELWRVRDVVLDQGPLERLRSVGRITVYSSDQTDPVLQIGPVEGAHELYDRLRDAVSSARKAARVVPIEGGA